MIGLVIIVVVEMGSWAYIITQKGTPGYFYLKMMTKLTQIF